MLQHFSTIACSSTRSRTTDGFCKLARLTRNASSSSKPWYVSSGECCIKGKHREETECTAVLCRDRCFDFVHPREKTTEIPRLNTSKSEQMRIQYRPSASSSSCLFRTSPSFIMFTRGLASSATVPRRQSSALEARKIRSSAEIERDISHVQHPPIENAWDEFLVRRRENSLQSLEELQTLAERISAHVIDLFVSSRLVAEESRKWGKRIQEILSTLEEFSSPTRQSFSLRRDALQLISLALCGEITSAEKAAERFLEVQHFGEEIHFAFDAMRLYIASLYLFTGPANALTFVLKNITPLNVLATFQKETRSTKIAPLLVPTVLPLLKSVGPIHAYFESKIRIWDSKLMQNSGDAILFLLCSEMLVENAAVLFRFLQRHDVFVPISQRLLLVRVLAKAKKMETASRIFDNLEKKQILGYGNFPTRDYNYTGLYLHALRGDIHRVDRYYKELHEFPNTHLKSLRMLAATTANVPHRAIKIFKELQTTLRHKTGSVPLAYYTTIIRCLFKSNKLEEMHKWIDLARRRVRKPDAVFFNVILNMICTTGDATAVSQVLDQMRLSGLKPTVQTYTAVINLFAKRRDPLSAEAIYKRMISEGVKSDLISLSAVMNAHVEAGSWDGVVRIYKYLEEQSGLDKPITIEIFNTLLKAYVLVGSPLYVVMNLFQRFTRSRGKPTDRSFALLIQSACDNARMDVASDLFFEMEDLSSDWRTNVQVTSYVLTIIMAAFLRRGDQDRAKAVYDDMIARDLKPSSPTFFFILKTYANEGSDESLQIAEDFVKSLLESKDDHSWATSNFGRTSGYEQVHAPLMRAHGKRESIEEVERLHKQLLNFEGKTGLTSLVILMDSYTRVGDFTSVQRVWEQIVTVAMHLSEPVTLTKGQDDVQESAEQTPRKLTTDLCIPLSKFIQAASDVGEHRLIAKTWNFLRDEGLQFDSHNWNHLAVSLVAAGEPERAFEVVERVLLPYQMQVDEILRQSNVKSDNTTPSTPLTESEELERLASEPPHYGILRGEEKSVNARNWQRQLDDLIELGNKNENDYTSQLSKIGLLSPNWNVWRPHYRTLDALASTLNRLEAGLPPELVGGGIDAEGRVSDGESGDPPGMVLQRIYENYPNAVQVVNEFERRKKRSEYINAQFEYEDGLARYRRE